MSEQPINQVPHVPTMSANTTALIAFLKEGKVGDVATDEKLTQIARRDTRVKGNGYANLQSAIRYVERNHGIVWSRIKGADSLKCLSASEAAETVHGGVSHIRRSARRYRQRAAIAANGGLEGEALAEVRAMAAICGTIEIFSRADATKKLTARGITEPLTDPAKMLELFKK